MDEQNMNEQPLNAQHFNDLAGRIEGLSWAVLNLTAALEKKEIIDGPHLSTMWRQALNRGNEQSDMRQAAREYLATLAQLLGDARQSRQLIQQP